MSLLAIAGALLPALSKVLERAIPDPAQQAKAQLELLKLQQDGAFKELDALLQTNLAQAKINEVEAAQSGVFKGGWRPAAGWVCAAGMAYEFLLRPILPWALTVAGVQGVPELPSLDDMLFELILGMLGLGTMRSVERHGRVKQLAG